MIIKSFLIISLLIGSINAQQIGNQIEKSNFVNDLESSASQQLEDLNVAESGIIVAKKKDDVIAGKVIKQGDIGLKGVKKELEVKTKKFGKKKGFLGRKRFKSKGFKGGNKIGAFGSNGKKFKKFNKKRRLNKIASFGYKKRHTSIKTFGESKAFKFGKVDGFKADKGSALGFGKKRKKFKDIKLNGFKKNVKAGKKKLFKIGSVKSGKKILAAKKTGSKKVGSVGGGKVVKNLKKSNLTKYKERFVNKLENSRNDILRHEQFFQFDFKQT